MIIVFASFWQVFVQVLYGVADVDVVARDTARSFGLDPWRAGPLPVSADGAAVPDDGAPAGGIRRADPRDHRRDGDRQLPASGAPSCSTKPPGDWVGVYSLVIVTGLLGLRDQPGLPLRSSAGPWPGTSRFAGRKCCDPVHEHRAGAAAALALVAKRSRESVAYAHRAALPAARALGCLGDGRAGASSSRGLSSSSRRSSTPGSDPAFFTDVLPSLGRLALGIVLVDRDRHRRRHADRPEPVAAGAARAAAGVLPRHPAAGADPDRDAARWAITDAMKIAGDRLRRGVARAAEHHRGRPRDRQRDDRDRPILRPHPGRAAALPRAARRPARASWRASGRPCRSR